MCLVLLYCLASGGNVFRLLARREVCPRTKNSSKRLWGEASKSHFDSVGSRCEAVLDARRGLVSWYCLGSLLFSCYIPSLVWGYICFFFFELLPFFQGGGRNIAAFIGKILSIGASSKVNYSSSLQPRWEGACFYTVRFHLLSIFLAYAQGWVTGFPRDGSVYK